MKLALNATFFGLKLGTSNDTLMTILLIVLTVICVLLVVLMIYILCSKKLADVVRETVIKSTDETATSQSGTGEGKEVSSNEMKKEKSVVQPAAPVKTQYGYRTPQKGTYGNRKAVSTRPYALPTIVLPPIWINTPSETEETTNTTKAKDQSKK